MEDLDLREAFDSLTYVMAEFSHPLGDGSDGVTVRALVDTGSTDCDLDAQVVRALRLPTDRGAPVANYETADGRISSAPIYTATIRVLGREAVVRLSASEEDADDADNADDPDVEFGLGAISDEAVIGHHALAVLGLLVDCGRRQLVPMEEDVLQETPSGGPSGFRGGMHVPLEISNPDDPDACTVVSALVDSGSTDVDLDQRIIESLKLQVDASQGTAQFETAGGLTIESPMYSALARVQADDLPCRTSLVRVGPSQGTGDEALLGHDALSALGLLVDCRHRCLLAAPTLPRPPRAAA